MKFMIDRETLLKPLQLVSGVVERRQTLPILANILLKIKKQELSLTGTDLEVEMLGRVRLEHPAEAGEITVPARKLMDICKSLPEQALLDIYLDGNKLTVHSGRSRFNLTTLPATDFPSTEEAKGQQEFVIRQQDLRQLINNTQFAMAQQDVRYYLNGMLWEVADGMFRAVATDGHRLALSTLNQRMTGEAQVIVPRKAVLELSRLLADNEDVATVVLSNQQLRVKTDEYTFTSKLIDGRFPDYTKVLPQGGDKLLIVDRDVLKQALVRVAVLANEKHRSVRLEMEKDLLRIATNNPEQEEAEEELSVNYRNNKMEIAFNINYLMDAITALPAGQIKITLAGPDSSARVESVEDDSSVYVVMPMRI